MKNQNESLENGSVKVEAPAVVKVDNEAKLKAELLRQKKEKEELLDAEKRAFDIKLAKMREINTLERQYNNLKVTKDDLELFDVETKDFNNSYAKIEIRDSKGKTFITQNSNLIVSLVEHLKKSLDNKIDEQEGKILGFSLN